MAEHDIEKIVEAGGEVFNFRDPTKESLANKVTSVRASSSATDTNYPSEKAVAKAIDGRVPIYDNGSDVPHASTLMCLKINCPQTTGYNKAQVLLFDITSFADGTINNNDAAYVGFSGFLIGGKPQGAGVKICVKICAKVSYTQLSSSNSYKTLQSDSSICGPEIVKRVENGVDKYYLSIFYESTLYTNNNILVGQFMWRKPTNIDDYSYSSGVIGISYPNQTYPANEPLWDRVYTWESNVAALTSHKLSTARKLKTNLARTADSTFDGSADQENIPVKGTLPVGNGGTGKSSVTSGNYLVGNGTSAFTEKTPKDAGSDVLKSLDTDNGDVVDGDFIVTSYHVNASTISSTTFVRRTAVKLWNYIKSKLSGSDVNIGGNAATATTAQNYDTSTGTIKSALAGKSDTGHVHNTDANEVTNSAVASELDVVTDTTEIVTTNTAGYGNSSTQDKKLYRRPIKSKLWPWIKGLLYSESDVNVSGSSASCTGNAATASAAASGSALETAINGKAASSHTHKTDAADVTSDDTNLGDATDGMQFVTTYADNTGYSSQHKELYRRPGIKIWNWIKSHIDSYTGVVHTTGNEEIAGTKTFFNTTQGIDFDLNVQSVTNRGTHKVSVGIGLSGNRGLWDYGGTGIAGEGNWIVHKDPDNVIHVGDDTAQRSKVKIGGITLDFSGTVGTTADTLYIV